MMNSDQIEISVIMPVYKAALFIERSIQSLVNQSFKDFELILVDDCGGDDSIDIAKRVLDDSPMRRSYKIIINPTNLGVSASRGEGIKHAAGNYIIHLDSDDWFESDLLEAHYSALKKSGADLSVSGYIAEKNRKSSLCLPAYVDGYVIDNAVERSLYLKQILSHRAPLALWNKMVSREIYEEANINFETNLRDDLLVSPLLVLASNRIVFINSPLVHYVLYNSSSVSFTLNHLHLVSKTLIYLEERFSSDVLEVVSDELFAYKVRVRRNILLHKEIPIKNILEPLRMFPEINSRILSGDNPEKKIHYRILTRLSADGATVALKCLLRLLRLIGS